MNFFKLEFARAGSTGEPVFSVTPLAVSSYQRLTVSLASLREFSYDFSSFAIRVFSKFIVIIIFGVFLYTTASLTYYPARAPPL